MKQFVLLFLAIVIASCATTKNPPNDSDGITISYDEFQKMLFPGSVVYLQGQNAFLMTIAMNGEKYKSIYRYDVATKKFSKQYDHGYNVADLSDDRAGKNIYVHIDDKGDENYSIYTYDVVKKSIAPLFGKPKFKSFAVDTDEKGEYLFFISNYENKAVYSIYRMDLKTKNTERLSDGKTNLEDAQVARSGNKVIGVRSLSNNENQLYLIDVKNKKAQVVFNLKKSVFNPNFFSTDEKSIFGVSDYKNDRTGCAEIKLGQVNKVTYIISAKDSDIVCDYNEGAKLFTVTETNRGKSTLKLYKSMFKDEIAIPALYNNQSVGLVDVDKAANKLILKYSASNNPGALYYYDLNSLKTELALNYNLSSLSDRDLANSYDFDYKSFDGMNIHAIIYAKAEWLKSGEKHPLIVWPHGGPDFYESHNYRPMLQFLALNGFVVVAPNFRGSGGYGKKFETLNDKDWGGGHIKDLISAKDAAVKLPYVDESRVFLMGRSFGGYSTLSAITTFPTAFKAAVAIVAIGNLFTFMKSIPPDESWQTEFLTEVGDPIKDKALYTERSPFFHVDKIQIPLQIYQAENDVRTVKAEMDNFVAELKKAGKPVDYTVLKDSGHAETLATSKTIYEGAIKFFKLKM